MVAMEKTCVEALEMELHTFLEKFKIPWVLTAIGIVFLGAVHNGNNPYWFLYVAFGLFFLTAGCNRYIDAQNPRRSLDRYEFVINSLKNRGGTEGEIWNANNRIRQSRFRGQQLIDEFQRLRLDSSNIEQFVRDCGYFKLDMELEEVLLFGELTTALLDATHGGNFKKRSKKMNEFLALIDEDENIY